MPTPRGEPQIGFVLHDFARAGPRPPAAGRVPCAGLSPNPQSTIRNREIGFVLPSLLIRPIRHNSFSYKVLAFPDASAKLGLFRTLDFGNGRACPSGANWLCFARFRSSRGPAFLSRGQLGSFCTIRPRGPAAAGRRAASRRGSMLNPNPQSEIRNRHIGFVSHDRSTAASYFQHQTSHFKLLRLYAPPIPRRVAGIRTEKWIAPPSEIVVSPCPDVNKKNLGAGPFSVLDCCTNEIITGVSDGQGLPPNPTAAGDMDKPSRWRTPRMFACCRPRSSVGSRYCAGRCILRIFSA